MRKIFILFVLILLPSFVLANWQISGKVTGADGKPPVLAHVHLINFQGNIGQPFQTVKPGIDGQFELQCSDPGLYRLFVTAVSHNYSSIPLIIDSETGNINVDVKLASLEYKDQFDAVQIIGDWNKFGFNTAEDMQKQADGTFTYDREVAADTISYQLIGLTKANRSVNGTQSDYFVYDGGGDYRSVLKVKSGTVKIVFNPGKLVKPKGKDLAQVKFNQQNSSLQKIWDMDQEIEKERAAFQTAVMEHRAAKKDMKGFRYDWSKLVQLLTAKMDNEQQLSIRQFAAIQLGQLIPYRAEVDSIVQSRILKLLPTHSAMWAALPQLAMFLKQEESQKQQFIKNLSEENPDRVVRAVALSFLAMLAQREGDKDAVKGYYEKLKSEYGDVKEIQYDLKRLDPDQRIMVGKPVPDFEVTLLDGKEKVSNKSLLGKYYLIDFWAVWCGPCVGEMENLHNAYQRFKDKNFTILSLSLDQKVEYITKFREEKWKMPWLHAFMGDEVNKPVTKTFEVMAIPKPILVGFDGRIIATEVSLRGDGLEKTLADFLR